MNNMNINATVLILAAGKVTHRLNSLLVKFECPALLPLNTRCVASYAIEFYQSKGIKPILVIEREFENDVLSELKYLKGSYELKLIDSSEGVIDTLKKASNNIQFAEDVIVNVVTSVPVKIPSKNEVLIDSLQTQNISWSCISFVDNSDISYLPKLQTPSGYGYAFTGIFNLESKIFLESLQRLSASEKDLMSVIVFASKYIDLHFTQSLWVDCGHKTNYLDAKIKLISSRSFNSVKVDQAGVITKSSRHKLKTIDEFSFLQMLPQDISVFFPRSFQLEVSDQLTSYKMEYYGYPTVAELQLYWMLDVDLWSRFFNKIEFILNLFKQHPYSIGKKTHFEFYWQKLEDRIGDFVVKCKASNILDERIFKSDLLINGLLCKSYDLLKGNIYSRIDEMYNESDFCLMHGDFCFNNILFDIYSGVIRLIDPRGSFGEGAKGIFGDIKYDLAKFLHSSVYHYDYIVNYQFSIEEKEENDYFIKFNLRENHDILESMSFDLIKKLGYTRHEIEFLVALLFMSMAPLHLDSITKAKAMYLHGLYLLNKNLNYNNENLF